MATKATMDPAAAPEPGATRALGARSRDGACPGCGLVLPVRDGPRHAYLGASAECWELFHRLAGPADNGRQRRLVRAAYAAQHPGAPQLRSIQSVAIHLMDLCVLLERGGDHQRAAPVLGRRPRRRALDLHWLEPPHQRGTVTIADALDAPTGEERAARVEAWATEVWAAWAPHHPTVRRWLDAAASHAIDAGPAAAPSMSGGPA